MKSLLIRKLSTVFVMALLAFPLALLFISPVNGAEWWSAPVQLTTNTKADSSPSFSGDGTQIAFSSDRDANSEIYVMNATDGSGVTRLTHNSAQDDMPSFSNDGTKVAFRSNRAYGGLSGNFKILVMNVTDGDASGLRLLTHYNNENYDPSFSPDGSKIAFASNRDGDFEIYVVDAKNGDLSTVTQLTHNDKDERFPSFSPDGNKIAFTSNKDGDYEIYVMDATHGDESDVTQLTHNNVYDAGASFSGDGSRIAFVSNVDGNNEICVMDATDGDASGVTQLTHNNVYDGGPSFSSDGTKMAFRSDIDGDPEIFVIYTDVNAPFTSDDYDSQWHTTDVTITLTATDDRSDVNEIYYKINNGLTKKGSIDGNPVISTEGSNNVLEYWSIDNAMNEEPHKFVTVKIDKTPPSVSVFQINDGAAYVDSTSVKLNITAAEDTSGISQMCISNDGVWDAETWEAFTETKDWTLPTGDGAKTVYVKIKDNVGWVSQVNDSKIILDTLAPSIALTDSLKNGTEIRASSYTINWVATEAGSGIDYYEARLDSGEWTKLDNKTTTYTFSGLGDGSHTFSIKAVDKTGKSQTYSMNIVTNTSPIGGPGYLEEGILGVALAAVVVGVVLYKVMKRPKPPLAPKDVKASS